MRSSKHRVCLLKNFWSCDEERDAIVADFLRLLNDDVSSTTVQESQRKSELAAGTIERDVGGHRPLVGAEQSFASSHRTMSFHLKASS
jgi:hypothetical protein